MKSRICLRLVFALLFASQLLSAQTPSRYLVRFRNKGSNPYSLSTPLAFLSQRSIDRRTRYAIALDSTDLPLTPRYLDSLRAIPTVVILNPSRWLNQVSILVTDTTAANVAAVFGKINSFPFVFGAAAIAPRAITRTEGKFAREAALEASEPPLAARTAIDVYNYNLSSAQVRLHNGQFLHNIGLRGQGMVIGVLDAGFLNYLFLKAFDSARANGQILDTWDFVNREPSVNEDDLHGMECLSVMAANIPGQFVGTAPKAGFYLFRSEDASSEYPIEEHNWVCAAERVDSSGGELISSSLGYSRFDAPFAAYSHSISDLNGNITMAAIGADLAAKKGLLVVNSAGNEGANSWGRIVTPADGDSVLAVGAVNASGVPASFTSRGPSADGQVKPDVASHGVSTTVQLPNNTIGSASGTSFACPNMAGLAACLWQGFPEYNNMRIIAALRESGSRATNPNDTVGYGIPDVRKAFVSLLKAYSTGSAVLANCRVNLAWNSKDMKDMVYEIERSIPGQAGFTKVGQLAGSGALLSAKTLQFSDSLVNVLPGIVTYRIRQIVDTTVSNPYADYITSTTVNLASGACIASGTIPVDPSALSIVLMPNPTQGQLTLKLTSSSPIQSLQIHVINSKGQLVQVLQKSKRSVTEIIALPAYALPAGKYFVSLYSNEQLITTREFIKL